MVYIIIGLLWALFSELGSQRMLRRGPKVGDQIQLPDGSEGEVIRVDSLYRDPLVFQFFRMALNAAVWPLFLGFFLVLLITQRKGG